MKRITKPSANDAAKIIKNILTASGPQPHQCVAQYLIDTFDDATIEAAANKVGVTRWLDSKDQIWWALPSWSPTHLEQ